MNPVAGLAVGGAAVAGLALRAMLERRRPIRGGRLVTLNALASLALGALYAGAGAVVGPVALAAGSGFCAACSPLTSVFGDPAARSGGVRLAGTVLWHLAYCVAFVIAGFVVMTAALKARGY